MISDRYDAFDRQLIHALQLDGRAPFSRIATALGVSDQTVARRYTRHRTAGTLKVLGLTDPATLGEVEWLVRVQCAPDAAVPVAEALARRSDTTWVSLTSGGTEIAAVCRASNSEHSDALLLEKLPRTPSVVGVTAHCLLHEFYGGAQSLVNKAGVLTDEQIARLGGTRPPAGPAPVPGPDETPQPDTGPAPVALGADDRRMLDVLARDGRTPPAELAAATGWSPTTVRRRLAELQANGVLYFDVDYDIRRFGYGVTVALWMSVAPAELAAAGAALATHPEVAFACATTGPNNLFASVVCRDVRALYTYLTSRIAALPGVRTMESAPRIRHVKGAGPFVAAAPKRPQGRRR
ncbi:Lrp/AsnC family transcriptional regulator [Streptomyces pinistramenti]|uniref:Lrp/AsnC family transcriptional regulator n=1 Tax=Streptomyces pinistramenti TaxID=2884812 RepID=UPI001D07A18E|nr:Lrp/AsnC family transcriptional regulator [Streptomyces pinistramenti]MCB5911562.1 Lrp/AsnC family transcriptional regulator [Streptomyces pinistramenti]